ncbi:hypothetical protein FP2506_13874 [Fulvimarina pelagi HTCC2506]|uniref:PhnA-like protein n=2 Tax=Fulvimarina pelagi TaxID=217511 RepID=Q0G4F5_9HYPH|nr:hypothetical protein FP2506_13874 [Fulvimarina pelagi HTCC2506]
MIAWGAVIAGVILAVAIQLMLGLLGLGLGFGGLPGTDRSVTALASAAGIYSLVAALTGLFVGAFATSRFAGLSEKIDSILHGLVTWAVATLLVVLVLGGTASSVLGGAFGAVGASVEGLSTAASNLAMPVSTGSSLPASVAADLRALAFANTEASTGTDTGDEQTDNAETAQASPEPTNGVENFSAIAAALSETASSNERQTAVQAIQQLGGLSEAAAEQRLAGYQQSFDEMARSARQAADDAARSVAAASFSAFVALLLGAIVSILGGFLGRSRGERI